LSTRGGEGEGGGGKEGGQGNVGGKGREKFGKGCTILIWFDLSTFYMNEENKLSLFTFL